MTSVLIKKKHQEETEAEGEPHVKTKDQSDPSASHGMPKIASKPPEARGEEASKIIPYRCQRKYGLAD